MSGFPKPGESSSSVYLSEEEDEEVRQTTREDEERRVLLRKKKKEMKLVQGVSDSEAEKRRARKEKKEQDETERIMEEAKRQKEEREKGAKPKRVYTDESEMETERSFIEDDNIIVKNYFEGTIKKVQDNIKNILKAVNKESAGKINVSRADQQVVKDYAAELLNDVIGVILAQISLEKRVKEAESEGAKKEEIKFLKKKIRNMERGGEKRRVVVDDSDESEVSVGTGNRKERKSMKASHVEVSSSGSRWTKVGKSKKTNIKGRVIAVGKEWWKTPPLTAARKNEEALVISSKTETTNARELAGSIAKVVSSKEIGGAPKAVKTIRGGKVVIVSKDNEQTTKLKSTLAKIGNIEVKLRQKQLPLLRVSGVEKGMADAELVEKIRTGGELSAGEDLKIIKRITCRNPWRENVIIQTGIDSFKKIVRRGKVEIDCVLCFAEEYMGVSMCYRSCRFGHVIKNCKESVKCVTNVWVRMMGKNVEKRKVSV